MIQVDFYILHTLGGQERERLACRLADKAWHQGYRIYIQTLSHTHAKQLDDMLWTFKDISFVPHEIYPDTWSSAPISIGYDTAQVCEGMEVLINLTDIVPPFFAQFQRIAELVANKPNAREAGRERYRFYQKHDNILRVHNIYR